MLCERYGLERFECECQLRVTVADDHRGGCTLTEDEYTLWRTQVTQPYHHITSVDNNHQDIAVLLLSPDISHLCFQRYNSVSSHSLQFCHTVLFTTQTFTFFCIRQTSIKADRFLSCSSFDVTLLIVRLHQPRLTGWAVENFTKIWVLPVTS